VVVVVVSSSSSFLLLLHLAALLLLEQGLFILWILSLVESLKHILHLAQGNSSSP